MRQQFAYLRNHDLNDGSTWAVALLPYLEQTGPHSLWINGTQLHTFASVAAEGRQTHVPVFYCPIRKPARLGVGDSGIAGACADYAVNAGDDAATYANFGGGTGTFTRTMVNQSATFDLRAYQSPLSFRSISDGLSNTLLVGEKHIQLGTLTQGGGGNKMDSSVYNPDHYYVISRVGNSTKLIAKISTQANDEIFGSWHIGLCNFVFGDGAVRSIRPDIPGATLGYMCNRQDGQVINFGDF